MKKNIRNYLICWGALVILFNVIVFVSPIEGEDGYSNSFWIGYGSIMAASIVHLIYYITSMKEEHGVQQILNVPVIVLSYVEIFAIVVCGGICMIAPGVPDWITTIVCAAILAVSVVLPVITKSVGEYADAGNISINERTMAFREIIDDANKLLSASAKEDIKAIMKNVYDALRYSDPTTCAETMDYEAQIKTAVEELYSIAKDSSVEKVKCKSKELLNLIEIRNNKAIIAKRKL